MIKINCLAVSFCLFFSVNSFCFFGSPNDNNDLIFNRLIGGDSPKNLKKNFPEKKVKEAIRIFVEAVKEQKNNWGNKGNACDFYNKLPKKVRGPLMTNSWKIFKNEKDGGASYEIPFSIESLKKELEKKPSEDTGSRFSLRGFWPGVSKFVTKIWSQLAIFS